MDSVNKLTTLCHVCNAYTIFKMKLSKTVNGLKSGNCTKKERKKGMQLQPRK